ncbi:MAG: substrate-binding domain-containing protein [Thermoleophilia bacterium]|nr:substrate-binding domain-containing protein [Thermoleophilia bacterium]
MGDQHSFDEATLLATGVSRRRFLKYAGLGAASIGLGAGLASCTTGAEETSSTAATAGTTSTAATGDTTQASGLSRVGKEDLADQAAATGAKTIGYVALCGVCAGTARMIKACEAEAERRGWDLQVSDTGGDYSKAPGAFETFIQAGVDILVDSAIDPGALGDSVSKANAAGIPTFIESAPWAPGFECSVNQNTYEMGQKQALWIASRLQGEGNVAVITFEPIQVVARREAVLRAILGAYPGINIIETHTVDPTKAIDDARKAVETWLLKYPQEGDIQAIWGGWDDPAVGAATAVDASGRKDIFVIGNDAAPDVIEMMRSGSSFDGDIWVDWESMAVELFHQMDLVVLGQPIESRELYVNQPLISPHLANLPAAGTDPDPAGTYYVWPNQA